MPASLSQSTIRFHQVLETVVDAWLESARRLPTEARTPGDLLRRMVLPLETAPQTFLDPGSVVAELADQLMLSPHEQMRNTVRERLLAIASEAVCASGHVMEVLSEIVWETASRRVLLLPEETLDVSRCGVLAAISLANLSLALHQLRRHPKPRLHTKLEQAVTLPLRMAVEETVSPRPGDIWLLDMIARTVRLAPRGDHRAARFRGMAGQRGTIPNIGDQLLDRVLPQYVAASAVHKLVEADQFTPELARASKYRRWPGIESIINDQGAVSLNALIIGELARRVVEDKVGLARGAMIRFLESLLALEDPAARLRSRLFIARLFWEMLEQDDAALQPLFSDQRYMDTFRKSLRAVEEDRQDGSAELRAEMERLSETRLCLHTYEQYSTLAHVLIPPRARGGGGRIEEDAKDE